MNSASVGAVRRARSRATLAAATLVPLLAFAEVPYSLTQQRVVILQVDILDVGPEGTASLGTRRLDVAPSEAGTTEVDVRWGPGGSMARLRLEAAGKAGEDGGPHRLSLRALLTVDDRRIVSSRDLEMREESTALMDVYEQDRHRLVLVLRAESAMRPVLETPRVEPVGAPVRLHLQVDRIDGERLTSLETNDLHTFVGQSVEYSFHRGAGDGAESVLLRLRPVRVQGEVTEMEIEVTGSLPGDPDRLLLSRQQTLVSNRGTVSAVTVTSGEPPAGYRFAITPEF